MTTSKTTRLYRTVHLSPSQAFQTKPSIQFGLNSAPLPPPSTHSYNPDRSLFIMPVNDTKQIMHWSAPPPRTPHLRQHRAVDSGLNSKYAFHTKPAFAPRPEQISIYPVHNDRVNIKHLPHPVPIHPPGQPLHCFIKHLLSTSTRSRTLDRINFPASHFIAAFHRIGFPNSA